MRREKQRYEVLDYRIMYFKERRRRFGLPRTLSCVISRPDVGASKGKVHRVQVRSMLLYTLSMPLQGWLENLVGSRAQWILARFLYTHRKVLHRHRCTLPGASSLPASIVYPPVELGAIASRSSFSGRPS